MRSPKTTVSFHHGLPPHCSLVLSGLPLALDIVLDLPKDLVRMCLHACVLKSLSLVAHQALLAMEFSRQEYWYRCQIKHKTLGQEVFQLNSE